MNFCHGFRKNHQPLFHSVFSCFCTNLFHYNSSLTLETYCTAGSLLTNLISWPNKRQLTDVTSGIDAINTCFYKTNLVNN